MPGLNQLKKFSEDVKNLGKELDIRKERGEVVSSVPLPEHISEADDSQDFVLGMPLERGDVPTENDADVDSAPDVENAVSSGSDGVQPNLDSILDTSDTGDIDFSAFPELAALLENTSGDDSEASSIPDIDFPSNDTDSVVGMDDPVPQDNDTPSSDKGGASDSQNTDTADNTAGFDVPTFNEVNEPLVVPEVAEDIDDFDLSGFDDDIFSETSPVTEEPVVHDDTSSDLGNMPTDPVTDFNIPDFDVPDFEAPVTDNTDTVQSATDETVPKTTDLDVDSLVDNEDGASDFDAPVTDNTDTVQSATDETVPETTDLDVDSLVNSEDGAPEKAADIGDIGTGGFDLPDFDGEEHTGSGIDNDELAKFTVPDENVPNQSDDVTENTGMEDTPIEVFDAPDDPFAGEDFGDATNFDDFAIPGFSDQAPGTVSAKSKRRTSSTEKAEKNTLTDKEYEAFLRNLKDYPLNLRIEIEKFIVGDEFKDEVVYDVIQKVIKKVSARHLASHLEKLLDINIPVPREFERRTVAQYEEYKKSAEYQLKNRIIPAAIIGLLSACILFLIFLFAKNFI